MKIYFASDHAGFELKSALMNFVRGQLSCDVEDCGAFEVDTADDYPAFVAAAARSLIADLADGLESRAIVIGGSGQGEAMAANRFKGIRCALYYGGLGAHQHDAAGYDLDVIASTREHNNSNALAIGGRFVSQETAEAAVKQWIETPFSGDERHERRNGMLDHLS